MRLRGVIWNPWQNNGKLRNMKNQSFKVLCHKQIRNARRGSKEKSVMKHILDDSHVSHFLSTSWSPIYAYYISFRSSGSQQSNASNSTIIYKYCFKFLNHSFTHSTLFGCSLLDFRLLFKSYLSNTHWIVGI